MTTTYIQTAYGRKAVDRKVGISCEYVQTLPANNEPNGAWWVLDSQKGYVPVSGNCSGLLLAIAEKIQAL